MSNGDSFVVAIRCEVNESLDRFEQLIASDFITAVRSQHGYLGGMLWKSKGPQIRNGETLESDSIVRYQLSLCFVDQDAQRKWVATDTHDAIWREAKALASSIVTDKYQIMVSNGLWHENRI